jgi:hypothetical protein
MVRLYSHKGIYWTNFFAARQSARLNGDGGKRIGVVFIADGTGRRGAVAVIGFALMEAFGLAFPEGQVALGTNWAGSFWH